MSYPAARKSIFMSWILCCLIAITASAQQAPKSTLAGRVTDTSGALIPGARVELHSTTGGLSLATTTDSAGHYSFSAAPAAYLVTVIFDGFAPFTSKTVTLQTDKAATLDIRLAIADQVQQVDVPAETAADTDPTNNGDQIVLRGKAIDQLPTDPGQLSDELNALAGSSSPDLEVNGFSGGKLPPKDTIREIRINQNPYSAQYDTNPIDGRIQIFTKPGSGQFHGDAYAFGNDSSFNSLNPFIKQTPPYHSFSYFGDLSGPITKHTSFFVTTNRNTQSTVSIVNAQILDPVTFAQEPFSQAIASPSTGNGFSTRIDTSVGKKSTLMLTYSWFQNKQTNGGIGSLSLADQAFDSEATTQTLQVSNSQIVNAKIVNDTRFQYIRSRTHQTPGSTDPAVTVQGAFTMGGSNSGASRDNQDQYELQNYVAASLGKHYFNFGGRLRVGRDANRSRGNYNGSFIFSTLTVPSQCPLPLNQATCSTPLNQINSYQVTLCGNLDAKATGPAVATCAQQGMQIGLGLTPEKIRAAGGGASQYSVTTGTPNVVVSLADVGLFLQDDWKARPNLTLSAGLRFETQNDIADHGDWAPRAGFAWNPFMAKGKPAVYTVRGGAGIFYRRFTSSSVLQTERQNGITQQQFVVSSADCPNPTLGSKSSWADCPNSTIGSKSPSAIYQISPSFHAPYNLSSSLSLQRQIGKIGSITETYTFNRGVHNQLLLNVNAPLPGTYDPSNPASGVRPLGGNQNVYQYTSEGVSNSNRLATNFFFRYKDKMFFYGFYNLRFEKADTAGDFPTNQYDIGADYGRAANDTRNSLTFGASGSLPWNVNFGAFMYTFSGSPFNILVGQDLNGDAQFNDRPAFATDLTRASVVHTAYGNFDTNPMPGQTIIPKNYGQGPPTVQVSLNLGKSFEFGPEEKAAPGSPAPAPAAKAGAKPAKKPHIDRKYSLSFTIYSQNVLNHVNLGPPVGTLSSPLFGKSITLSGFSAGSANRTVSLQTFFRF